MFVLFSAKGNETPGRSLTSPRLKPSRGSKVVAEDHKEAKAVAEGHKEAKVIAEGYMNTYVVAEGCWETKNVIQAHT
jgi:hypothetical protein